MNGTNTLVPSTTQPRNVTLSATIFRETRSTSEDGPVAGDFGTPSRIVLNTLQTIVMLAALYVLVALIIYESKIKRSPLATLVKGTVRAAAAKTAARFGKWLRRLCILGAVFCFLSCINDLVYYNAKLGSDSACTVLQIIGVSLLTDLDTTVYTFLWLRQYAVYQNLRLENRAVVIILSLITWNVLILIIALCVVMNGLLIRYRRHVYDPTTEMCGKVQSPIDDLFTHLWTAGSVSLQVILVGLFVFPLLRHSLTYGKRATANGTSPKPRSQSGPRNRMMSLVRRCVIITGLCVGTDIIVMLLTERLLIADKYRQLRPLFYNINILFNLVLIVTSFREWRDMLFFVRSQKAWRKLFSTKGHSPMTNTVEIPLNSFASSGNGNRKWTHCHDSNAAEV